MKGLRFLYHRVRCWYGKCDERRAVYSQDGISDECVCCGKVRVYVTAEQLRDFRRDVKFSFESVGTP